MKLFIFFFFTKDCVLANFICASAFFKCVQVTKGCACNSSANFEAVHLKKEEGSLLWAHLLTPVWRTRGWNRSCSSSTGFARR